MERSALFLFAPKFAAFGVDTARAWADRARAAGSGTVRIHGLCTGSEKIRKEVSDGLGPLAGEIVSSTAEESGWLAGEPDPTVLKALEARYPAGTFSRTIVADRRVGRGLVRNGATRPDAIGDTVLAAPTTAPRAYVAGLYAYLEAMFDRTAPDVVFCYAVAGAPAYALWAIATARGIPFRKLTPTRVGARYVVDDNIQDALGPVIERFADGAYEPSNEDLDAARAHLKSFRDKPEMPEYQKRNDALQTGRKPVSFTLGRLRKSAQFGLRSIGSTDPETGIRARRKFWELKMFWAERLLDRSMFSSMEDVTTPFVFYPLHVSPEASTMVLTPHLIDQIAVIEALSKSLPAHMSLVVKEHLPMLGKRPAGYYETIAKLPGTFLVGPEYSGLQMVQKADLTAVITGTAAWESFMLGKPPLVIGTAAFLAIGEGAVQAEHLGALPEAIRAALSMPPAREEKLERYLAALMDESFDMPAALMWDDYAAFDAEVRKATCAEIANRLPLGPAA
ncbi:hypothetical protein CLV78_106243 [Aliiruegeria haliotis]|uniref:Capsule polysaccharide biosynthesis protein n=1 Tax=Aliiruegeria haliotis TaxID=1280846 RepID=A0A2T0RNH9_9RHOB|nr:hypothetical protein [Aliiruegeria haliotis]PRY22701.1 hypothetical protein CLV78_106243 [Aliiruegeria haliotis]